MDNLNENYLPLWTSRFTVIRDNKLLYVDKTGYVGKLAKKRGVFFLARPRRFGKSLLVSTLETLFRDGMKKFKGLKIDGTWNDKTYKVLKLDFSYARGNLSVKRFLSSCWDVFANGCKDANIPFTSHEGEEPAKMLSSILREMDDSSFVLLIDEYDAPLTANINTPRLFQQIRAILSDFYSTIKGQDQKFRFVFLTGIAKFHQASIFSGLNNLIDISLQKEYGEMLGYTEDEVIHYFGEYISEAAFARGLTKEKMLEELREQYDGFCFDKRASTHVYAPWSILNFCQNPTEELQNYWYSSSSRPSVLLEFLKNKNKFDISYYLKFSSFDIDLDDLSQPRDINSLRDDVLLVQTGYLTIKKAIRNRITVGYPNKEVSSSMARLAIECMMNGKSGIESGINELKEYLLNGDISGIITSFNNAFLSIPYQQYSVTSESACRNLIQMLLRGAEIFNFAEHPSSSGRSDLEVFAGASHWVFEFKFIPKKGKENEASTAARDGGDADAQGNPESRPVVQGEIAKLAEALGQIRDRRYGEESLFDGRLIRVALVFSQKDRRFVEWETYPLSGREDALARPGWAEALAFALRDGQKWEESLLLPLQKKEVTLSFDKH